MAQRPSMSIETIKRTPLPTRAVILTVKCTKPTTLIRPFQTFTIIPTSRFAQRVSDFATEAAAAESTQRARAR
jgi:hypothetical protein